MNATSGRRARAPRLAPADAPLAARVPVADVLRRRSGTERHVLALLLVEGLSVAEAALALGLSEQRLERAYRDVLGDLRRAVRPSRSRWRAAARLAAGVRLRRAA